MTDEERLEQTRPTGNGRARGLVSSRTSGQRVHAQTYAPAPGSRAGGLDLLGRRMVLVEAKLPTSPSC